MERFTATEAGKIVGALQELNDIRNLVSVGEVFLAQPPHPLSILAGRDLSAEVIRNGLDATIKKYEAELEAL